jgi:hypothetical protein
MIVQIWAWPLTTFPIAQKPHQGWKLAPPNQSRNQPMSIKHPATASFVILAALAAGAFCWQGRMDPISLTLQGDFKQQDINIMISNIMVFQGKVTADDNLDQTVSFQFRKTKHEELVLKIPALAFSQQIKEDSIILANDGKIGVLPMRDALEFMK